MHDSVLFVLSLVPFLLLLFDLFKLILELHWVVDWRRSLAVVIEEEALHDRISSLVEEREEARRNYLADQSDQCECSIGQAVQREAESKQVDHKQQLSQRQVGQNDNKFPA